MVGPAAKEAVPLLIVVAAALEAFEVAHHAIEIVAHLLDLRVHRLALRRPSGEQSKKSAALAAELPGLRQDAVEFRLLLGNRVFIATGLIGAHWVGGAPIERSKLRFVTHAHGI